MYPTLKVLVLLFKCTSYSFCLDVRSRFHSVVSSGSRPPYPAFGRAIGTWQYGWLLASVPRSWHKRCHQQVRIEWYFGFWVYIHHCRRVEEIAKKKGISMAQVSVAWCLAKEGVTAPIVGTTKLDNLKDILG